MGVIFMYFTGEETCLRHYGFLQNHIGGSAQYKDFSLLTYPGKCRKEAIVLQLSTFTGGLHVIQKYLETSLKNLIHSLLVIGNF